MARPRKPTSVIEATGGFKKNPSRKREDPITIGPIGDAPDYFTKEEKTAWVEIVNNAPLGVLAAADRMVVESVSRLVAEMRCSKMEDFTGAKMALIISGLGRLGMTPADRSKVSAPKKKEKGEWDNF